MHPPDRELAIAAAAAGAAVVRAAFGAPLTRHDKGAGDFATAADLDAERAILAVLHEARPADAIVGEESGASGSGPRRWLVDPLCGTLNFAAGTMAVAVNVALRDGGRTTTAAVADPFTGEIFWTAGDGAFVRPAGAGPSLTPPPPTPADLPLIPSAATGLVDVNLDPPYPIDQALALLAAPSFAGRFRPRVLSTTLALTWVATGRRAAYVTGGDLRDSVHFAAGLAVCEAAGCVVTALDGSPLHSGDGVLAAADEEAHAALLAMLTREKAAQPPVDDAQKLS
ncbi:inositol monophosphatase family protein [Actinoplanes sp. CA-030573]|uniref:inositol monophosphatase family protein n=1 Tax=Actinoplanes sp. CA-030573 TaxID=3239898 RepID=UPI003D93BD61